MHVNAPDESEVTTTLLVYGRGEPATWDEIKILLGRSNAEATFSYTLKPLREDEDFEWEHQGPPLALLQELCLGSDNGVEIRQQAEPGRRAVSKSPTPLLGQVQGGTGEPVVVDSAPDPEVNEPLDDEDQAEINAFLSGGGGVTERKPAIPQSEFSSNDRALMLTQHDGIDVFTPEGLHEWQTKAMSAVAGQQPKLGKDLGFKDNPKVTSKQRRELLEHREQGEIAALSVDPTEVDRDGRYYQVQAAFTGAESQVGPFIEPSKVALGMKTTGKHGLHQQLEINAIAFMLQRSTGGIPVSEERAQDPEVASACLSLESVCTFGGYLVDVTGMGKTDTALGFASQYALYGRYANHSDGHRPMLITTPNGAVFSQWVDKIFHNYQDLTLIISNDDKPSDAKFLKNWVSSTAMREAPHKLDNWPDHLRYVFNINDSRASKVVIISPFDSHSARTMDVTYRKPYAVPTEKVAGRRRRARRAVASRTKAHKDHQGEVPVFTTKWKGRFSVVICDEGHRVRHVMTKIHASIQQLGAKIYWFFTATPVMNTLMDILGGLMILWPQVSKALEEDRVAMKWLMGIPKQGYEIFDHLDALEKTDIRRTIAIDPVRIEALLLTGDVNKISRYYHFMDELISIRRSTASILTRNKEGDTTSMRSMMPKHQVKTADLEYNAEEAVEAQFLHRIHARDYYDKLMHSASQDAELITQSTNTGPDTRKESKTKFPPTTGPLRRLTITAKSTKLSRLDLLMRSLGFNTLVKDMEGYRSKGHSVDWFIDMTARDGDIDPKKRYAST